MKRFHSCITGLALILFLAVPTSWAAYPDKPISMVVPYGAGGSTDVSARIVAGSMERILKQPVLVKNVSGAGGLSGLKEVVTATPDGYTIGYLPLGPLVFQPHMRNLPHQIDDIEFIAQDVDAPYVVLVSKQTPWNSFEDMKKDLLANPKKYRYGSSGAGSQNHIALADLFDKIGADVQHVPFPNDADMVQSMAGGHVQISAGPMSIVLHYDMRPLLVLDRERLKAAPDVPTCLEKNLDVINTHWHVLIAPQNTPKERITKLTDVLEKLSVDPDYVGKLQKVGMDPQFLPPAEIYAKAKKELERYRGVIQQVILKKE